MKKKFIVLLILTVIAAALFTGGTLPGSSEDPLVSKSYVDDKFNQILNVLSAFNDAIPTIQPGGKGAAAAYTPVSVGMGQALIGGEGTEIILRSGKAIGYCPGENGMVNITTGIEVFSGTEISLNHMLIVPRNDGRGALVIEDAWFLVKGDYTIK